MADYPQKLYRTPGPDSVVVNNDAERESAINNGYVPDVPAHDEYPKMVYLHPVDKTQGHRYTIVNNPAEKDDALGKGYRLNPHVPIPPPSEAFETKYEAPGSGSERWPNSGWTEAGDGTGYPGDLPTQAQADSVAAKAEAEREERRQEITSQGDIPEIEHIDR